MVTIPTLQKGSKGAPVVSIQEALHTLGFFQSFVDGDFGPVTKHAVADFQSAYLGDGIADSDTTRAIYTAVRAWDSVAPNLPFLVPHGLSELVAMFGSFVHEEGLGGQIVILDDWAETNIVSVDLPILGRHQVHKKLQGTFLSVAQEIQDKGLDRLIESFGTWSTRHKMHDPARSLSTHSWAISCDVNWRTNMPGKIGDIDPELVAVFERHGFNWGGRWRNRDDMHFQYCTGY